jgi:acyl-CoA thioesterase-2
MTDKLAELLEILDIEKVEENLFRAHHPRGRKGRLFGGQIMAQALMGAARTVPDDRPVHSLHGYFLRPGDPRVPAVVSVERIRDGRSFTTRRVVVLQHGEAIFNLDASFQVVEEGFDHQASKPELVPPHPDKIPKYLYKEPFISFRHEFRRLQSETPQPPEQFVWFKANGEVPNGPLLHACLLVYESDSALLGTSRLPHRGEYRREDMQVASLDHAMWFHRPVDVSDWLLYAIDSPSTSSSRGYTRGSIFTESGVLVASTVQEGLIRLRSRNRGQG